MEESKLYRAKLDILIAALMTYLNIKTEIIK